MFIYFYFSVYNIFDLGEDLGKLVKKKGILTLFLLILLGSKMILVLRWWYEQKLREKWKLCSLEIEYPS